MRGDGQRMNQPSARVSADELTANKTHDEDVIKLASPTHAIIPLLVI